jgi:hypothetical protein
MEFAYYGNLNFLQTKRKTEYQLSDNMTSKSEKENRKEILRGLKEKEKADFNKSLPMDKETFNELFDHLDERLGEGCDHTMSMTLDFLREREVKNVDQVVEWLSDKGGYCDCEVLANAEELFE